MPRLQAIYEPTGTAREYAALALNIYQPAELTLGYIRLAIRALIEFNLPFTILTKSSLIRRDMDLLVPYRKFRLELTFTKRRIKETLDFRNCEYEFKRSFKDP